MLVVYHAPRSMDAKMVPKLLKKDGAYEVGEFPSNNHHTITQQIHTDAFCKADNIWFVGFPPSLSKTVDGRITRRGIDECEFDMLQAMFDLAIDAEVSFKEVGRVRECVPWNLITFLVGNADVRAQVHEKLRREWNIVVAVHSGERLFWIRQDPAWPKREHCHFKMERSYIATMFHHKLT